MGFVCAHHSFFRTAPGRTSQRAKDSEFLSSLLSLFPRVGVEVEMGVENDAEDSRVLFQWDNFVVDLDLRVDVCFTSFIRREKRHGTLCRCDGEPLAVRPSADLVQVLL